MIVEAAEFVKLPLTVIVPEVELMVERLLLLALVEVEFKSPAVTEMEPAVSVVLLPTVKFGTVKAPVTVTVVDPPLVSLIATVPPDTVRLPVTLTVPPRLTVNPDAIVNPDGAVILFTSVPVIDIERMVTPAGMFTTPAFWIVKVPMVAPAGNVAGVVALQKREALQPVTAMPLNTEAVVAPLIVTFTAFINV